MNGMARDLRSRLKIVGGLQSNLLKSWARRNDRQAYAANPPASARFLCGGLVTITRRRGQRSGAMTGRRIAKAFVITGASAHADRNWMALTANELIVSHLNLDLDLVDAMRKDKQAVA
jgi:hypothetical protein